MAAERRLEAAEERGAQAHRPTSGAPARVRRACWTPSFLLCLCRVCATAATRASAPAAGREQPNSRSFLRGIWREDRKLAPFLARRTWRRRSKKHLGPQTDSCIPKSPAFGSGSFSRSCLVSAEKVKEGKEGVGQSGQSVACTRQQACSLHCGCWAVLRRSGCCERPPEWSWGRAGVDAPESPLQL